MRSRSGRRSLIPTGRVIFNSKYDSEDIEAGDFNVGDEWIAFTHVSGQYVLRVVRASLVDQIIRQESKS